MTYQKEYTKEQINEFRTKDKRISFLSIFSSISSMFAEGKFGTLEEYQKLIKLIEKTAYEVNDNLYETYPFENGEEEKPL